MTGSDNGLSPDRQQAIIRTCIGILLIEIILTIFMEIAIIMQHFHTRKAIQICLQNGSASLWPQNVSIESRNYRKITSTCALSKRIEMFTIPGHMSSKLCRRGPHECEENSCTIICALILYVAKSTMCRHEHDDVIKWKHFPRNWPLVRGIHRSPVNSPHKGQWRGALMFSLICVWINGSVNNREAGDLRRYRDHYDAIVMEQ